MASPGVPRPLHMTTSINSPGGTSSAGSWMGPSSYQYDHAPPRPAFAGPSSRSSSGSSLAPSSPNDRLSPHTASSPWSRGNSLPRTPSPTNPFFPSPQMDKQQHGLGLNVLPMTDSPFPANNPLPAGVSDLSNYNSESGMAGVGRRAFQAAAWGVTAGIALSPSLRDRNMSEPKSPIPGPKSAGALPSTLPPWQQSESRSPREPVILPKKPLSMRQRSGTVTNVVPPLPVETVSPPSRTAPLPPVPQPHAHAPRANSVAASDYSTTSSYGIRGDTVAELLKARSNTTQKPAPGREAFFERYKEMQRSNSGSTTGMLTRGASGASRASNEQQLVTSPQQTTFDLEFDDNDDDDETSSLPWASPAPPEPFRDRKHSRNATADSAESARSGGSRSSGKGGSSSSPSSAEVVTPSISLEQLTIVGGKEQRAFEARRLNQITESDEDDSERVVFGPLLVGNQSKAPAPPPKAPSAEAQTRPLLPKSSLSRPPLQPRSKTSPSPTPRKSCQKCGTPVGGQNRYVERDGVVLCVEDWKKMYLPSCRRCNLLIETKMISADDGQLKGKWHASCFTCTRCDEPFKGKDFYVHAGRPWCQYHYAEETNTLCASTSCRRPIEGACVVTQGSGSAKPRRYHPGHFHCDVEGCKNGMDEYYEVGEQRFCETHVKGQMRAEKRKTRLVDLPGRINL